MATKELARPGVRHLLARVLDEPALVAEVRALPPAALAKLITHVGLEDAGEIVALATTEQIERVFDEDLWTRDAPGEDEDFDGARFVTWLHVLLEAGDAVTARRLAELSPDVVTLAFHRLVAVVDLDEAMNDDTEDLEEVIEVSLHHEIGPYMVFARRHDGWDAVLQALVALDEHDHATATRLFDRLVAMTEREAADEGGLYQVLTAAETLADDVAGDRNDRRAREGFIAPADARAFLKLARTQPDDGKRDPITKAYFRDLDRAPAPPPSRLASMIDEAGVTKSRRKALPPRRGALAAALAELDPTTQAERLEELAFLVNVLLAGDKRAWRPAEAAEEVVRVVERGLETTGEGIGRPDGVVRAFRAGSRRQ